MAVTGVSAICGFDVETGRQIYRIDAPGRATAVAVTNDQRCLAYGTTGGAVAVLDALSGKTLCQLTRTGTVRSLAFSADGSLLAVGTDEKSVEIWGSPD